MHADSVDMQVGSQPKVRLITVAHLDGRTRSAQRARQLVESFTAQLGGALTATKRLAVERAATMTVVAEHARASRLAGDQSITLDDVVRCDRAAAAAVRALDLDRRTAKPMTPALHSYLADKAKVPAP